MAINSMGGQKQSETMVINEEQDGVDGHFFADDCQIYLSTANIDEVKTKVFALLSDIKSWMRE